MAHEILYSPPFLRLMLLQKDFLASLEKHLGNSFSDCIVFY